MGVEWRSKNKAEEVPKDAILGGTEPEDEPLYIARAYSEHHGESAGLHPGKFGPLTGECALFGFEGEEWYNPKCEILCGDQNSIKWLDIKGSFPDDYASLRLVEGGKDAEGNPLFCAQVELQGSVIPGKAGPKLNGATASFDGKELPGNQVYKVLAHL